MLLSQDQVTAAGLAPWLYVTVGAVVFATLAIRYWRGHEFAAWTTTLGLSSIFLLLLGAARDGWGSEGSYWADHPWLQGLVVAALFSGAATVAIDRRAAERDSLITAGAGDALSSAFSEAEQALRQVVTRPSTSSALATTAPAMHAVLVAQTPEFYRLSSDERIRRLSMQFEEWSSGAQATVAHAAAVLQQGYKEWAAVLCLTDGGRHKAAVIYTAMRSLNDLAKLFGELAADHRTITNGPGRKPQSHDEWQRAYSINFERTLDKVLALYEPTRFELRQGARHLANSASEARKHSSYALAQVIDARRRPLVYNLGRKVEGFANSLKRFARWLQYSRREREVYRAQGWTP